MDNDKINVNKISGHWISTSDNDYQTMMNLFGSKDNHWALFMGHLVIEKLLKGKIVKNNQTHAPFTHDLRKLNKVANLDLDVEMIKWLDTITTFNLNARYDDYKQEFYRKCTDDYTKEWIEKIKSLRSWIKTKL